MIEYCYATYKYIIHTLVHSECARLMCIKLREPTREYQRSCRRLRRVIKIVLGSGARDSAGTQKLTHNRFFYAFSAKVEREKKT